MKGMIKSMPFSTKPFAMFPFKSCVKKVYMLKKIEMFKCFRDGIVCQQTLSKSRAFFWSYHKN